MYETIVSTELKQEWLYRGTEILTFSREAEREIQSLSIKLDSTVMSSTCIWKLSLSQALFWLIISLIFIFYEDVSFK
jgi:hypothetical protein